MNTLEVRSYSLDVKCGSAFGSELKIDMMQKLVLELDWCKLGSRVKALPGEGQNFNSFGRAEMEYQTNFRYVLKPTFPNSIIPLANNFLLSYTLWVGHNCKWFKSSCLLRNHSSLAAVI